MTPIEVMAKAIDEQITSIYGSPGDKGEAERMARAALLALAECIDDETIYAFLRARITIDGVVPGVVMDMVEAPDTNAENVDSQLYVDCGLPQPSGQPYLRNMEEGEFKVHVVRCGVKAMLRALSQQTSS